MRHGKSLSGNTRYKPVWWDPDTVGEPVDVANQPLPDENITYSSLQEKIKAIPIFVSTFEPLKEFQDNLISVETEAIILRNINESPVKVHRTREAYKYLNRMINTIFVLDHLQKEVPSETRDRLIEEVKRYYEDFHTRL